MPRRDGRDLARILSGKAAGDEVTLEKLTSDADVPDEVLGFHAQQAIEKLLKAVLAHAGAAPPRSHDLAYLHGLLEETGVDPPAGLEELQALTLWATEFRYEETLGQTLERSRALELVRAVRRWADDALLSA